MDPLYCCDLTVWQIIKRKYFKSCKRSGMFVSHDSLQKFNAVHLTRTSIKSNWKVYLWLYNKVLIADTVSAVYKAEKLTGLNEIAGQIIFKGTACHRQTTYLPGFPNNEQMLESVIFKHRVANLRVHRSRHMFVTYSERTKPFPICQKKQHGLLGRNKVAHDTDSSFSSTKRSSQSIKLKLMTQMGLLQMCLIYNIQANTNLTLLFAGISWPYYERDYQIRRDTWAPNEEEKRANIKDKQVLF